MRNFLFKLGLLSLFVLSISVFFAGCEKDNSTNSLKLDIPIANPYELIGVIHNDAMEIIYNETQKGILMYLYDFATDYVGNRIPELDTIFNKIGTNQYLAISDEFFIRNYENYCLSNAVVSFEEDIFEPLQLTRTQQSTLQDLFNAIEYATHSEEIEISILKKEALILSNNDISEYDKVLLLGTISVLKHSYLFTTNKLLSTKDTPSWLQQVKKVLKADGLGFLLGCAASLLNGSAAAGMTFGPQGFVMTVAASGAKYAVVTSGSTVVNILVDSKNIE